MVGAAWWLRDPVAVLLGGLLVNYPILSAFDSDRMWFGIPVLYLYVFGVWAALIVVMALVIER